MRLEGTGLRTVYRGTYKLGSELGMSIEMRKTTVLQSKKH